MRIGLAFFSIWFLLGSAACNTISGAGQDVKAAGEAIEDVAEDVKDDLEDDDDEIFD